MRTDLRFSRTGLTAGILLSLVLTLTACTATDALPAQYKAGDDKGYISGDSTITEIPAAQRKAPIEFAGTLDTGSKTSGRDYTGHVLVVNFWWAQCPPCRLEAKQLASAFRSLDRTDVSFLGVNTFDAPATSRAFAKAHDLAYPSVMDAATGSVRAAFSRATPLQATPVTLVLDRTGRVAARIVGPVAQSSILTSIVRTVESEAD